jgi:hypothetical protein
MQRMKREERRDKGAAPESSCHAVKKPEEQQCAQYMQDKVGCVITARIHAVKLIIEHQGKPGQRMPEFGIGCAKRPAKSIERDSGLNVIVFRYVNMIIEIDKTIVIYLPVNSERNNRQNDINDQFLFLGANIYFI